MIARFMSFYKLGVTVCVCWHEGEEKQGPDGRERFVSCTRRKGVRGCGGISRPAFKLGHERGLSQMGDVHGPRRKNGLGRLGWFC